MKLADILAYLKALGPILEPEIMNLEQQGMDELNALVASVSSPDLKLLLQSLVAAVDAFAKAEVQKLNA